METNNYLQILRDVKDVAFATVDANGMPQVRIIDIILSLTVVHIKTLQKY